MTTPEEEASGGALRDQMVAFRNLAIDQLVGNFKGLKPSDFDGVPAEQMQARATEIAEARTKERETVLQEALAERGLSLEALGSFVQGEGQPPAPKDDAASRVASLGKISGTPPSTKPKLDELWGEERLMAAAALESAS